MEAICTVYHKQSLRFTPRHCDHFLHLGLKQDIYPYGIVVAGVAWGWYVLHFGDVWKILPECQYFLEDDTVCEAVKSGRARIVTQDWRHPATNNLFPNVHILTDRTRKRPFVFDEELWKGECLRCGTCCSVPRRKTGKPCEYLKFVEEL